MAQIHYSPGIDLTTGALDTKHELITQHYFRFDNFIRAMIYQELKS